MAGELGPPIIAATAGILGAFAGGFSTYIVTHQQLKAAAAQAEREAKEQKKQRQEAINGEFLADANLLFQAQMDRLTRPIDAGSTTGAVCDGQERLGRSYTTLQLSAPLEVAEVAEEIVQELHGLESYVLSVSLRGDDLSSSEVQRISGLFRGSCDAFINRLRPKRSAAKQPDVGQGNS